MLNLWVNSLLKSKTFSFFNTNPKENKLATINLWAYFFIITSLIISLPSYFITNNNHAIALHAIQKFWWATAVIVGIKLYKPSTIKPWIYVAAFFIITGIRNIIRMFYVLKDEQWIINTSAYFEVFFFALGSIALSFGSFYIAKMRFLLRDKWALMDSIIITTSILAMGIRLGSLPILHKYGYNLAFISIGIIAVYRSVFILVPILAAVLREKITGASFYLYTISVFIIFSIDYYNIIFLSIHDPNIFYYSTAHSVFGTGQAILACAALLPSMRYITISENIPRPQWNIGRTLIISFFVIIPIIILETGNYLNENYRIPVFALISLFLLSLLLRMRMAVVETIHSQETIQYLAYHDELTSLPNRRYLNFVVPVKINEKLSAAQEFNLICLYIDLDGLKYINDRFGHQTGDKMILSVSNALNDYCIDNDNNKTVIRVGGDEFVVLVFADSHQDTEYALSIAEQLQTIILKSVDDVNIVVRSSIGVALLPFNLGDQWINAKLDKLLGNADLAQVEAKLQGGSRVSLYRPEAGERARRRDSINRELPQAWKAGQMCMAYQPIVNLQDAKVYGAEALLRWKHPELGMIPPDEAILAAEQIDIIVPLGQQIVDRCLTDYLMVNGLFQTRIGINLSGNQLLPNALESLIQQITDTNMGKALWLEITEQELVRGQEYVAAALIELRRIGAKIAIDDFGTGFCGLDYLCNLPVDIIKFDGVFSRQAMHSNKHRRVIQYGVQLANSLGAVSLAEGIEDLKTAYLMRDLGCLYGQGYWFSKPVYKLQDALLAKERYIHLLERNFDFIPLTPEVLNIPANRLPISDPDKFNKQLQEELQYEFEYSFETGYSTEEFLYRNRFKEQAT